MSKILDRCTPEEVGISSKAIELFLDSAGKKGIELHSIMLLRHGKVCAEGWWKPYSAEFPHIMYSFSKSLTATAIGFAEQEGYLKLSDRLVDIFPDKLPENPSDNLKKATIKDLLIMGVGHGTEPAWSFEDWIASFLAHPFEYEPGTMFQYNTVGTNMLVAILKRKTGKNLTEFLRPRLLDPLGIGEISCLAMPDGTEIGGAGYSLRTEDMARFIQFYLQEGTWEGKQILNKGWFAQATSKQIENSGGVYNGKKDWGVGYGYQFWRCQPEGVYRADGMFGQFGIVCTELDAVIIITEGNPDAQGTLEVVWETLLPAMKDAPLPLDKEAASALLGRLNNLKLPSLPARRSKKETEIEKSTFIAENESVSILHPFSRMLTGAADESIEKIAFSFNEGSCILQVTEGGVTDCYEVGLKGKFIPFMYRNLHAAAVGSWKDDSTFEVIFRLTESVFGCKMSFVFQGDSILLYLNRIPEMNMSSGGELEPVRLSAIN